VKVVPEKGQKWDWEDLMETHTADATMSEQDEDTVVESKRDVDGCNGRKVI
jgi:hypothetical protein